MRADGSPATAAAFSQCGPVRFRSCSAHRGRHPQPHDGQKRHATCSVHVVWLLARGVGEIVHRPRPRLVENNLLISGNSWCVKAYV